MKKGDRVIVQVWSRPAIHGLITGESHRGDCWIVLKDGTKHPTAYSKNFCKKEQPTTLSSQQLSDHQ